MLSCFILLKHIFLAVPYLPVSFLTIKVSCVYFIFIVFMKFRDIIFKRNVFESLVSRLTHLSCNVMSLDSHLKCWVFFFYVLGFFYLFYKFNGPHHSTIYTRCTTIRRWVHFIVFSYSSMRLIYQTHICHFTKVCYIRTLLHGTSKLCLCSSES